MSKWLVGRTPDSDSVEVPKSYADAALAAGLPSVASVRSNITTQINTKHLVTKAYVDQSNAQVAQKAAVDAADALYVPTSALSAPNGVAGVGSDGNLIPGQVPAGVPTEFLAKSYDVHSDGLVYFNQPQTVLTNNLRELRIASITIPDPGYPWRPIPRAFVLGGDPGATQPNTRTGGTGTYGMLTVMPPHAVSDQVYGTGICTDSWYWNFYEVMIYAAAGQTPTSVPPVVGGLELDLYGCCWSGTGYQFSPEGLLYWILCAPAL